MSARERILAIAVIGLIIVAGVGVVFYQFYLSPARTKQARLEQLRTESDTKQTRVNVILSQRPQLERYRQQSLPAELEVAKLEYTRYLEKLLRDNGFRNMSVTPKSIQSRTAPTLGDAKKTPIYTPLGYAVSGTTNLESIVAVMEGFYRKGMLHQIRTLSIQKPLTIQTAQGQRPDDLDVTMSVEALVVNGADKRPTLMPGMDRRLGEADVVAGLQSGPIGLGALLRADGPIGLHGPGVLAQPERDYSAMSAKNIFIGPARGAVVAKTNETELEPLRFTTLNEITTAVSPQGRRQAMIYNVADNEKMRVKTLGGFNEFSLLRTNQAITLVHGEVLKIDDRSLVFHVVLNSSEPEDKAPHYRDRERVYSLHKNDLDALTREGAIRTDDASRVFWVDKGRWEFLIADKMVKVNGRAFAFKWDLVKGFVIRQDADGVIIRIDDKYCSYRYSDYAREKPAHEGFCTLRIGGNVADALATPLKDAEIKEVLAAH
jgi:hypothetical protein